MTHLSPLPKISNLKNPSRHFKQNSSLHPGGNVFGLTVVVSLTSVVGSFVSTGSVGFDGFVGATKQHLTVNKYRNQDKGGLAKLNENKTGLLRRI